MDTMGATGTTVGEESFSDENKQSLASDAEPSPTPNPFAVSAVRPGVIPFIFPAGTAAIDLIDALEDQHHWRGQIIGPHGSGKSTLLAALIPELEADGRRVLLYTLRDGQHSLPEGLRDAPQDKQPTILIIDGYEQLKLTSRWCLRLVCRLRGWALLVTAHRDMGLPTLCQTSVNRELATTIVDRLLKKETGRTIDPAVIDAALARHDGNLRCVLFELYDEFERGRR
ncbi:MAG: hypothetical protein K8T91_11195 [Planctomycetes bacterium]|nr:hypothetical protein [Planctomycetota bacterium]